MMTGLLILLCVALALQTVRASTYKKLADTRLVRAQVAEEQLEVFYDPKRGIRHQGN